MSPEWLLAAVREFGVPLAAFLGFVWAGARQWIVWGWNYREIKDDRDFWRDLALSGLQKTDQAISVAKRIRS